MLSFFKKETQPDHAYMNDLEANLRQERAMSDSIQAKLKNYKPEKSTANFDRLSLQVPQVSLSMA